MVYVDEIDKTLKAKIDLKPNMNLGVMFKINSYTGDYIKDFERINDGKYLRQNNFRANCKVKFSNNLVEIVTTRKIKAGETLYLQTFPWLEDKYLKNVQKYKEQQRKKLLREIK